MIYFISCMAVLTMAANAAAVVIGADAALPVTERMCFSRAVNFAPGNGETCDLNPPRFRWQFHPDTPGQGGDYHFIFEIAASPEFDQPLVHVKTGLNFYNTLAPLPGTGPFYWRIGCLADGSENAQWSGARKFSIAENAEIWDRSLLERPDFHNVGHPRLMLNQKTLPAFRRMIEQKGEPQEIFKAIQKRADAALISNWWDKVPESDVQEAVAPFVQMALGCTDVAFCYLVTDDQRYAGVKERALRLAAYPKGGRASPEGAGGESVEDSTQINEFLALTYDWLYQNLSESERAVFEQSLQWRLDHVLNNFAWRQHYPEMKGITPASLANLGFSHGYEGFFHSFAAGLALYEQAQVARDYFEVAINYMAGVGTAHGYDGGWNEGPGYALSKWSWQVNALCYLDSVFPAYNAGKNPWLRRLGEFLRAQTPAGIQHAPWGHGSNNESYYRRGRQRAFLKLAYLTGDGRFLADFQRVAPPPDRRDRPWIEATLPLWRTLPEPVQQDKPVRLFPEDGWVMALSGSPINPATYQEGTGMIFAARPRGGYSHSFACDNSFHWFAFGHDLSHAAGTSDYEPYAYCSMSHNTILVDGLGQAQPRDLQRQPWFARIAAFKQQDNLVYWCGDATNAYPKAPFRAGDWWGKLAPVYEQRQLPALKRVQRHVLFVDNRYFVLLDDLEAESPAQWTWLYHILDEDGFSLDETSGSFEYQMGDVHAKVVQLLGAGELGVEDLRGLKGLTNPLTGEDYREDRGKARGERSLIAEHNLWLTTREKHARWQFLTVLFPWRKDDAPPNIERIDNLSLRVTQGGEEEVISFSGAADADVAVDLPALRTAIQSAGNAPETEASH